MTRTLTPLRHAKPCWLALTLWACSPWSLAAQPAGMVVIQPAQATSLGVQSQVVQSDGPASANVQDKPAARVSHPAVVLVPASQQRVVAAPAAGLIEAMSANAGDTVKAGQAMVRLRSPQVQELARDVQQANSQMELAKLNLNRDELLLKEGMVALSRVEISRAQLVQAQAQAKERQQALRHITSAGTSGEGGVLTLSAPMGGRVLEVVASVGQRVDAMTPLYKVATLNPLWLDIQVPIQAAQAIQAGDTVTVNAPGQAKPLSGQVISLGAEVDKPTQTVVVRARIANPPTAQGELSLRPGQMVEAQLAVGGVLAQASAVTIPAQALLSGPGQQAQVLVDLGKGRYQNTPVTVLGKHAQGWRVTGLPAGSRVVTQGSAALRALLVP